MAGAAEELVCYSLILTETYPGSEVIPHKDSIIEDPKAKSFINMVFFIRGSGGQGSGGLCLSRDNELREIIIAPTNLFNSCLIYDSLANFYHGFEPVRKGKFRWALSAQFCEKDYVSSVRP